MNTDNLLDEILLMLRSFKGNREQLEKLHQYILTELYSEEEKEEEENTAAETIVVPERYAPLVKDVADSLSAGLVCYINPATMEKVYIPQSIVDTMMFDEEDPDDEEAEESLFYEDLKRINRNWEQTITIEPPESRESFSFMEQFVDSLPESRISNKLSEALSKKKPFSHFNSIIHQSDEREAWFAFRQKCLENYVAEILAYKLWNDDPDN